MSRNKNEDGCEYCPSGKYVTKKCDAANQTTCDDCKPGTYTELENYLNRCHTCRGCFSSLNQQTVSECTASKNTICKCNTGFYCTNNECERCNEATTCPLGEGVISKAIGTNDTVCAKCENGTFSNVTDYSSSCIAHTRCEDYGREMKTPGSTMTDAVCGNFKFRCSWMLPAGLWSGLALTILLVAVFMIWRAKRKSRKAGKFKVSVTPVEVVPTQAIMSSHCQESCNLDSCKLTLLNPDTTLEVSCIKDSFDSSVPLTPVKVSVSFAETNPINGSGKCSRGSFLRLYSEPQEDEWCEAE